MAASITGGVSPAMAYQPLHSPGYGHGSDGENDGRRRKVTFSLTTMVRILVTLTAFVNIIVWIKLGVINPRYSPLYLVFMGLFLVIIWNLAVLVPRSLPTLGCQIGSTYWVLNDGDHRDWPLNKPRVRLARWKRCLLTAAVDVFFGLTIILIMSESSWQNRMIFCRRG